MIFFMELEKAILKFVWKHTHIPISTQSNPDHGGYSGVPELRGIVPAPSQSA